MKPIDSFGTRTTIQAGGENVYICSLRVLERAGYQANGRLPYSLKVVLENLLRNEDDRFVKAEDIQALARWDPKGKVEKEIAFTPARVLLQDFTGVPALVDLAAMREGIAQFLADTPEEPEHSLPAIGALLGGAEHSSRP